MVPALAPPTSQQNTFGLLRHGTTRWNEQHRIQGSCDSPLTKEGKRHISLWAEALKPLKWNRILASDLGRAQETVRLLNKKLQLPFSFDSRLQEQDWGEWEQLTLQEIHNCNPGELEKQISLGWNFCAPGGESRLEVLKRSQVAIFDAAKKWPTENILIISHQGVMRCLLYHIAGREFLPTEKKILHKDRLHTIVCNRGELHIKTLNIANVQSS